jgi:hypothetical protein
MLALAVHTRPVTAVALGVKVGVIVDVGDEVNVGHAGHGVVVIDGVGDGQPKHGVAVGAGVCVADGVLVGQSTHRVGVNPNGDGVGDGEPMGGVAVADAVAGNVPVGVIVAAGVNVSERIAVAVRVGVPIEVTVAVLCAVPPVGVMVAAKSVGVGVFGRGAATPGEAQTTLL